MVTALLLLASASPTKIVLDKPFLALADGKPIQVEIGHAAPIFADYDGDQLPDLLVGQFGEGKLRIYKNIGTREAPKFDKFEWFQAAGQVAKVEAG